MRCHIGSTVGWVGALLLLSSLAFAQNETALSTAREMAKEGLAAYDQGRYPEAAKLLEGALQVVEVPTLDVYAARALAKTGRPLRAAELYMRATRLKPQSDWAQVQYEMQQTAATEREQLLPRIPRLRIEVSGAPIEEVEIQLDGAKVAPALLQVPQMVEPGEREVLGRRGTDEVRVKVAVAEGETQTAQITFQSAAANPLVTTPPPTKETESSSAGKTQRLAGWVTLGVGGAGLLFGGITGIVALGKDSKLEDGGCRDSHCYDDQQSDVDSFNQMRTLSTVGFVVGAVATAGGVTLLLTAPKRSGSETALELGVGTASIKGSF